ncbi:uncharacterized protein PHACADRAFT_263585 [Phanerochaete carnosa HHB-10118-sp]|uniref:Uncharacterized protein n=1 Tax=Phanerochaete carnosa (strain HHB-10118-sp) TaxID=650164 RepID=K5VXX6_PHACS|nr:uncharacterized protein PHACADRAFT_263585 [Phanerochaete carnosa HHB-10118-sp]EKM51449.1 hypothetical protein PHACADRAFT_263585 [Phanerochaete carnosa HHB-10118-sp]
MQDVIRHERERAVARRITAPDLAKWPNSSLDRAGYLVDWHIFVGPDARTLKLKQLAFTSTRHQRAVCMCHALSADGKFLAASFDTSASDIFVWRLPDGLLVQCLRNQGHSKPVRSLSFSPNGPTLVSLGSYDETVIIWDVQRGCVLRHLIGHHSRVASSAYSLNGALVATADMTKIMKIWDTSTGACLCSFNLNEHVYQITFSLDSSRLWIRAGLLYFLYDVQSYNRITVLRHKRDNPVGFSMSRQGDRIVTGTYHGNGVTIRDAVTGRELLTVDDERKLVTPVAFSPDGAEVLVVCQGSRMALAFDSRTGQRRHTFELSHVPHHIAYSPNGDYVVLAGHRGSLEVYNAKSRTFVGKSEGFWDDAVLQEVVFLPDSQTILSHFSRTPGSHEPLRLCNIQDVVRLR